MNDVEALFICCPCERNGSCTHDANNKFSFGYQYQNRQHVMLAAAAASGMWLTVSCITCLQTSTNKMQPMQLHCAGCTKQQLTTSQ
jgi:hypothetical protein